MTLKKFLIANRLWINCCKLQISWDAPSTLSSNSLNTRHIRSVIVLGDVVVAFFVFTVVLILMRCNLHQKHRKLNWNEMKRYHVFLTKPNYTYDYRLQTLYYSIVLDVECCAQCRSVAFHYSSLPVYYCWNFGYWFLSLELKSIKCFCFLRVN